jgi:hypothetical protein
MKNDNQDLLEIYDNNDKPEYDFFAESKDNAAGRVYFFMLIVMLICIGIKFFQSLPSNGPNEDAIIFRQVQLLNIVQKSKEEQEIKAAIQEYDSLSVLLQEIETTQ